MPKVEIKPEKVTIGSGGIRPVRSRGGRDWDEIAAGLPALEPLFGVRSHTPHSPCAHKGPIKDGSKFVCMCCHKASAAIDARLKLLSQQKDAKVARELAEAARAEKAARKAARDAEKAERRAQRINRIPGDQA
jgi:hypothetical protein